MPLLLKDATKFALRAQKRPRAEGDKGTAVYPVQINDDAFELQLVPSGSDSLRVKSEPLCIGEGRYAVCLSISSEMHDELFKIEEGLSELVKEKHPDTTWFKSTRPPAGNYSANLHVKFYGDLQVYDSEGEKTEAPKSWRGVLVTPILNLKAWVNDKGAGIWWNLVAVKITRPPPRAFTFV